MEKNRIFNHSVTQMSRLLCKISTNRRSRIILFYLQFCLLLS